MRSLSEWEGIGDDVPQAARGAESGSSHSESDCVAREADGVRPLLTIKEVQEVLNVSRRTVARLIADGDLEVVRIKDAVRIRPEELERYIESRTNAEAKRKYVRRTAL